jgi:3-oxoacyl-(acyl-carrier-protein) synthase
VTPVPIITGIGLATPLGTCLSANWTALYEGRFVTDHATVAGFSGTPRLQELAAHVAFEAMGRSGSAEAWDDAALVFGTSKGPVTDWLTPGADLAGEFGLASVAAHLGRRLRIGGPTLTISAACASGLHALIRGVMLIRSGEFRRVMVVAAESSVHPLFIGSFARMGILAPEGFGCRPMDRSRAGLVMSEAAAGVVLEAVGPDRDPSPRQARHLLAQVENFALGGDASHLTGGDANGAVLRHLLARVIDGRPLDLVHAHGTGTVANDAVELEAIESSLAPAGPVAQLYSHKGALGHSLGAAGLVSVVLNCASHRQGVVLPNARTIEPLPTRAVVISREACERPVRRSVAVAAGFGGAMAAVSLVGGGGRPPAA